MSALAQWVITMTGGDGSLPLPDHVHAVMTGWLRESDDEHTASEKPYTVRRIETTALGVEVEVSTLTSGAGDRLVSALAAATDVRLGRQRLSVLSVQPIGLADWDDLLDSATPAERVRFEVTSPMVFRPGRRITVMPAPGLVFGHLRARWSRWAPADRQPHLDLATTEILTSRLEGTTRGWAARRQTWPGFVGTVEYDLGAVEPRDQMVLTALASLAPFCGIGANTTVGMGAASSSVIPRRQTHH